MAIFKFRGSDYPVAIVTDNIVLKLIQATQKLQEGADLGQIFDDWELTGIICDVCPAIKDNGIANVEVKTYPDGATSRVGKKILIHTEEWLDLTFCVVRGWAEDYAQKRLPSLLEDGTKDHLSGDQQKIVSDLIERKLKELGILRSNVVSLKYKFLVEGAGDMINIDAFNSADEEVEKRLLPTTSKKSAKDKPQGFTPQPLTEEDKLRQRLAELESERNRQMVS